MKRKGIVIFATYFVQASSLSEPKAKKKWSIRGRKETASNKNCDYAKYFHTILPMYFSSLVVRIWFKV